MAGRFLVDNCEELQSILEAEGSSAKKLIVYFTGKEDIDSGRSWCSDCVKAHPVIEKHAKNLDDSSRFITCIVGDRPTWKDAKNPFRIHPKLRVTSIPTLLKYGTNERLGSDDCAKDDLVHMLMFE